MSKKTKTPAPTFMFLFRTPAGMPDPTPEEMQKTFQKWMKWINSMQTKGQYLSGEPLEDVPARVLRGPRGAQGIDAPFAGGKEVIGGYMLIAAKNLAAASRIAKGCPGYANGGSVEIRRIMPMPM